MLCEVGVVTITLLHLFSGTNPNEGATQKRQDLGAALASLATTVLAFGLTVAGAGSAVSGLEVVARKIIAAGSFVAKRRIVTRLSTTREHDEQEG